MEVILTPCDPFLEARAYKLGLMFAVFLFELLDQCLAILLLLEAFGFLTMNKSTLSDLVIAFHAFPAEDSIVVWIAFQLTSFFD